MKNIFLGGIDSKPLNACEINVLLIKSYIYQPSQRIAIDLSNGACTGYFPILLRIVGVNTKKRNKSASQHLLLTTLLLDITNKYGPIPLLTYLMQPLDFIINKAPRSDIGLSSEKWKIAWPALIGVLREIDLLSHLDEIFDEDEPAPEEALE
ncbi:hypothetical protein INT45_003143 [Circinella minor]|uniref:Uncharacterized protein n=1 Tax=Circinella minor TaxID=1195481 RepID=A0A8H7VDQ6_9FUNG|nr:hypothetical protein INT45_003143 [Circinella minor]